MINLTDFENTLADIQLQVTDALTDFDTAVQAQVDAAFAVLRGADEDTLEDISDELEAGLVLITNAITASQGVVTTAITATETAIRGADGDDLKDISDEIAASETAIRGTDGDDLKTINDKQDLIQPIAADNLSTLTAEAEAVLDLARSPDSGTKTLTGGEDTLYEETDATAFLFNGGSIDLSNQAGGDTVIIRQYKKIKSGGAYVGFTDDAVWTFAGVPDPLLINISGDHGNMYGFKVTIEQTVVAAPFDVDHEWYDSKQGG